VSDPGDQRRGCRAEDAALLPEQALTRAREAGGFGIAREQRDQIIRSLAALLQSEVSRHDDAKPCSGPRGGRPKGVASRIAAETGLSIRTVQRALKGAAERVDCLREVLPDGARRPQRACPSDFRQTFLRLGQSKEIEEFYCTNWRVIRRWIEEAGGEELRTARRDISGGTARPALRAESRRKRYVLGRTLASVTAHDRAR